MTDREIAHAEARDLQPGDYIEPVIQESAYRTQVLVTAEHLDKFKQWVRLGHWVKVYQSKRNGKL